MKFFFHVCASRVCWIVLVTSVRAAAGAEPSYPPVVEVSVTNLASGGSQLRLRHRTKTWSSDEVQLPLSSDSEPDSLQILWQSGQNVVLVKKKVESISVGGKTPHRLVIETAEKLDGPSSIEIAYTLTSPKQWDASYHVRSGESWRLFEHIQFENTSLVTWGHERDTLRIILRRPAAPLVAFALDKSIPKETVKVVSRATTAEVDANTIWIDVANVGPGLAGRDLHLRNIVSRHDAQDASARVSSVLPVSAEVHFDDTPDPLPTDFQHTLKLDKTLPTGAAEHAFLASPEELWSEPVEQAWLAIGKDAGFRVLDVAREPGTLWLPVRLERANNQAVLTCFIATKLHVHVVSAYESRGVRFRTSAADQHVFAKEWTAGSDNSFSPAVWIVTRQTRKKQMDLTEPPTAAERESLEALQANLKEWNMNEHGNDDLLSLYAPELKLPREIDEARKKLEAYLNELDKDIGKLSRVAEDAATATARQNGLAQDVRALSNVLTNLQQSPHAADLWLESRRVQLKLEQSQRAFEQSRKDTVVARQAWHWLITARNSRLVPPWTPVQVLPSLTQLPLSRDNSASPPELLPAPGP